MSTQNYKEVGELIKSFRLSKGWTSNELAQKIGISYPTVSRLENGHFGPSGIVTKKLAELGMNIEDIAHTARAHSKEQTYAYRISDLENRILKLEDTLKKLLDAVDNKGGH